MQKQLAVGAQDFEKGIVNVYLPGLRLGIHLQPALGQQFISTSNSRVWSLLRPVQSPEFRLRISALSSVLTSVQRPVQRPIYTRTSNAQEAKYRTGRRTLAAQRAKRWLHSS